MQEQFEITGNFETENSSKYLIQLCKHFAHKIPATVEGDKGQINFDIGTAALTAHDTALTATLVAGNAEALARLQHIVDDHLKRFAFREDFAGMTWQN
ncbi:DUF2218 domain-containing protein [Paracoccus tegillarcae]|uniref:DUF2218 domain-containing protein n=1 Tax=Paracoccus tegillarcae TaxID=1529068 RepID=A0A2K9EPD8_9RHOB|nr:DUF2218 domain-containing protein [Paracoccus tegillarcae]AUH32566.1 DUF2218 domain-containing protein [Paracoccus tegillarcae]